MPDLFRLPCGRIFLLHVMRYAKQKTGFVFSFYKFKSTSVPTDRVLLRWIRHARDGLCKYSEHDDGAVIFMWHVFNSSCQNKKASDENRGYME